MAMQINGIAFPTSIERKSLFDPDLPPERGLSGQGQPLHVGLRPVILRYQTLLNSEFDYFAVTLLGGGGGSYLAGGTTKLYDHTRTLRTYAWCILGFPQFQRMNGNAYFDVEITIRLPMWTS